MEILAKEASWLLQDYFLLGDGGGLSGILRNWR